MEDFHPTWVTHRAAVAETGWPRAPLVNVP
jgi:hypothetical protein